MRLSLLSCLTVCIVLALPVAAQPPLSLTPMDYGLTTDILQISPEVRIGSVTATPECIRTLIADLGVGTGLYGTCTPHMSKGDLAAVELVKIGPPAVEPLIHVVQDLKQASEEYTEEANQRWFSVQVLGRIQDKRALSALDFCLRKEPLPYVRASAPHALELLNDPRAEESLLIGLQDAYPDIQASAAHALGALHSVRAIPRLIALLGEPERMPAVNRGGMAGPRPVSPAPSAALALGQIGTKAVYPLRAALASRDPQTHRFAALGLTSNASRLADTNVRDLMQDTDGEIRLAAAWGEIQRRDPLAVPILAALLHDPSVEVRGAAGMALSRSGGLPGLKALLAVAHDKDKSAADAAAEGLRDIWDPKATDLLLDEVKHGKGPARMSAAESLRHMSDPRTVATFLGMLSESNSEVRVFAVYAIYQSRDTRVFPAMVKAMDDPEEKVRMAATQLMPLRKPDPVVAPLLRRLSDPSEQVRIHAIYGLGFKGDQEAVAPLQDLLAHDTPRVQDVVRKALDIIAGKRDSW